MQKFVKKKKMRSKEDITNVNSYEYVLSYYSLNVGLRPTFPRPSGARAADVQTTKLW